MAVIDPGVELDVVRAGGVHGSAAAFEHAITEITGLTDQATAAAQAARESMRQVGLAAAALALPEPAGG